MAKIQVKCKHCNSVFDVESPNKEGNYSAKCPSCNQIMTFKVFPHYAIKGNTVEGKKAMTVKCPSCKAMFPSSLPSAPGGYGILCPYCKREIKIKMI